MKRVLLMLNFICFTAFIQGCSTTENKEEQIENPTNDQGENDEEDEDEDIADTTFQNPILSQGADPWVIQNEEGYYYTHTTGNSLELRFTEHMENLDEAEPFRIWMPPRSSDYSDDIWAPELHYIDNKWYIYFAATHFDGNEEARDANRRMYVLENSSSSPLNYNWEFKGKVSDDTDNWAIDGTVLQLKGSNYFIWSGWRTKDQPSNSGRQQLYIAKMTNPWTLESSRVMLSEPEYDWERNGLVNEGPVIWTNPEGKVFLFYSGSGCWTDDYSIGVISLENENEPLNPNSWKKHEKALFMKNSENSVFGTGHNSFFKSPDGSEDWILYHANDNSGEGCGGGRKPRIQKISWDEEGFPVLGIPKKTSVELDVPASEH